MPVYRSRTVLELARNLRAFLKLEAGFTRGALPEPETWTREPLRQAQDRAKRQSGEPERLRADTRVSRPRLETATARAPGKPLKVVHVSVFDTGGGARAAHRLHTGLRRLGHDSTVLASRTVDWCREDSTVEVFQPRADPQSRKERRRRIEEVRSDLRRYDGSRPSGYDGFTSDRGRFGDELLSTLPPCDVVNLHWVGGFVDFSSFFSTVPQHTPVVWTLHDMNAFTGGCHFDHGCGKFADHCGACPQLGSTDEDDLTRAVWRRKHEALVGADAGRLHIVGVSDWMSEQARRSSLFDRFPVSTIHLGLDLKTFAPRDRSFARSILGIRPDSRVVLFVAEYATGRRKGFAELAEALNGMEDTPNLLLLSLGHGDPNVGGKVAHRHLGYVDAEYLLSLIYSAADVFVLPSLQDNLPQTALQAMACGTPVAAFAVGGVPDMVRPGVTGELAPPLNVPALREATFRVLLDDERRKELSENCRRVVTEEFEQDTQANRYVELYRSMLGARA